MEDRAADETSALVGAAGMAETCRATIDGAFPDVRIPDQGVSRSSN